MANNIAKVDLIQKMLDNAMVQGRCDRLHGSKRRSR